MGLVINFGKIDRLIVDIARYNIEAEMAVQLFVLSGKFRITLRNIIGR